METFIGVLFEQAKVLMAEKVFKPSLVAIMITSVLVYGLSPEFSILPQPMPICMLSGMVLLACFLTMLLPNARTLKRQNDIHHGIVLSDVGVFLQMNGSLSKPTLKSN